MDNHEHHKHKPQKWEPQKTVFLLSLFFTLLLSLAPGLAFEARFDLNSDGSINDLDLALVKQGLNGEACTAAKTCDVTGDGKVTMEDYSALDAYLHYQVQASGPAHGTIDLGGQIGSRSAVGVGSQGDLSTRGGISAGGVNSGNSGAGGFQSFQSQPQIGGGMVVPPEMIEVGKPFPLHPGGSGALTATDGFMIFLTGIEKVQCLKPGTCPDFTADLEVRMRKDNIPRVWTINEGDSKSIGNYKISIVDIEDSIHQATIVVERTGATPIEHEIEPIKIILKSPFKLKEEQQGYTDTFRIKLDDLQQPTCPPGMNPPNTNDHQMDQQHSMDGMPADGMPVCPSSMATIEVKVRNGQDYSFTIPLRGMVMFQDSFEFYQISYTAQADLDVGVFVVTKEMEKPGMSRRVPITPDVPFKLQPGGTGFILGSDNVEFTITSIKLPHCTYPNGHDMRPLPHSEADMPMPPTCTKGTVSVSFHGRSLELNQESISSLNEKYVLMVRGIYGTEIGQRTAELMVTETHTPRDEQENTCPLFMPPPPEWCKGGKIIPGEKNEHGCMGHPQCVMMPGSDRDEHGCIPSAGYSWCAPKNKCLRVWEEPCDNQQHAQHPNQPPNPQPPISPQSCQGCKIDEKCIPPGTRLTEPRLNEPAYCDIDGTLALQKKKSEACQNNYECQSNTCADSVCTSIQERLSGIEKEVKEQRGILDRILGFFKSLFGAGD